MSYILEICDLIVNFPSFSLGPINLKLLQGRVHAYIGPNGAGKSTTIKSIFGAIKPDSGLIKFNNEIISDRKSLRTWINSMGIVTDNIFQWTNIKSADSLAFLSKMYDNWDFDLMNSLIDRLSFDSSTVIANLSTGEYTKLSIIAALSHKPSLLLLDEPTNGLDPFARNELIDILFEFMQNDENSILYSSHIIPEIDKIADEIAFLSDGKIILNDEKSNLIENWRKIYIPDNTPELIDSGIFERKIENDSIALVCSDYDKVCSQLKNMNIEIKSEEYMNLEQIVLSIFKKAKYD